MKTFCTIICLLMLILSQQVLYAQQPQVKKESAEDFVKLEMPLEEALTKITFSVTWLSGDGSDEVIFEGENVIRTPYTIWQATSGNGALMNTMQTFILFLRVITLLPVELWIISYLILRMLKAFVCCAAALG